MAKDKGPRARPVPLKLREGERPDRRPRNPPTAPIAATAPLPPEHLSDVAAETWNRLAPQLHSKGLLTEWDLEMFGIGCEAYAKWRRASQLVNDSDVLIRGYRGSLVRNPASQVARENGEVVLRWAREFGLTPSARSGIDLGEGDDDGALNRLLS
jgi:P27 family predicted phage terminase small subunit